MENFSLFKRFIAGLLDKILIVILFIVFYIAVFPYTGAGELGKFSVLITMPPVNYEFIDGGAELALNIYVSWIVFAIVFYGISEFYLGTSVFKRLFGGVLYSRYYNKSIKHDATVLYRMFLRGLLMAVFTSTFQRFSVFNILLDSFLIIDISILFKKRSLIDILSGTTLIERESIELDLFEEEQVGSSKTESTELMVVSNGFKPKGSSKKILMCALGILLSVVSLWVLAKTIKDNHKTYFDYPKEYKILRDEAICIKKDNNRYFAYKTDVFPESKGCPLPEGKFISSFSSCREETYLKEMIPYKKKGSYPVNYITKGGHLSRYYVPTYYTDYKYVYAKRKFNRIVSVFDVSDFLTSYSNDSVIYSKLLDEMIFKFDPNNEYTSLHSKFKHRNHDVASFSFMSDSLDYQRTVFFDNKRAYVCDVSSKEPIDFKKYQKDFLNSIKTFDYAKFESDFKTKLLRTSLFLFAGCLLLMICFIKWIRQLFVNLKSATIIQYTIKGRFMSR